MFTCLGSFDIKPVNEFAEELLEDGDILFFVFVFVYLPTAAALLILSHFKRLYDLSFVPRHNKNNEIILLLCYLKSFLLIF